MQQPIKPEAPAHSLYRWTGTARRKRRRGEDEGRGRGKKYYTDNQEEKILAKRSEEVLELKRTILKRERKGEVRRAKRKEEGQCGMIKRKKIK